MHHGMNPSPGDGFLQQQQPPPPQPPQPPPPRRLLAAVLGIQLALCFGPAQLTGAWFQPPRLQNPPGRCCLERTREHQPTDTVESSVLNALELFVALDGSF
ncbi:sushi domain-containing protein 4-like isoform X2 [Leptonychotes weddellii]|uniref:Sushi domain-containing protein 4-like isoform X2 n=1 Tax=Leptonychotes weddellii TaxID=9713 RepID=A0A7F8RHJ8_LEPWE|nr:sushi domain-containing protein 4-like isoform X2 [Leptonychotes weddellii]